MFIGMLRGKSTSAVKLILGMCIILLAALVLGGVFSPENIALASAHQSGVDPVSESGDIYSNSLPPGPSSVSNYVLMGVKWEKNPVTYSFTNCPRSLDCNLAHQAVREAVEAWDDVCGLRLDETTTLGDIEILWATGSHGDGMPFDGPGNQLAHAIAPVSWLGALAGDVHFDDDETWVFDPPINRYQTHLKTVAMHEVGHALGLDHSKDPSALMWERYTGIRGITPDDLAGIQALYGPPTADEGGLPVAQAPAPSNVTATATTTVRMRSGPGINFSAIDRISYGATVPVLGRNADGSWLFVDYLGSQGWAASHLFVITGDINTVPVVDQTGGTTPPSVPTGVTATAKITARVRSGPGEGHQMISRVMTGATVPVLGRNASNTWIYVEIGGVRGWSAAHLYEISGDLNSVPMMLISAGNTLVD